MVNIPGTPAMCRASYTRAMITTSACHDYTDGTTGTYKGSPTPYMPNLLSSAITIPSFDWDKSNRYSKWLSLRIELNSIFDTPTYTGLTAKDQITLTVHCIGPEMHKLYYLWPEYECDKMKLDIQHFLYPVTEVYIPIRAINVREGEVYKHE